MRFHVCTVVKVKRDFVAEAHGTVVDQGLVWRDRVLRYLEIRLCSKPSTFIKKME